VGLSSITSIITKFDSAAISDTASLNLSSAIDEMGQRVLCLKITKGFSEDS
jgi:hypothetical protein